jgi:MFS transporter, SP family, general alpha glucoside:H+ symporter
MATQSEPVESKRATTPPVEQFEHIQESTIAHAADQEEHDLGVWQTVQRYPGACAWCIYAIWCVICLSFDAQAANAIVGIPQFRKDFGYSYEPGKWVLETHWQSAFNAAPVAA